MATYDDGIPEDWYPGFFLDPRNAWRWMPSAIPGWLPPAMVRTPPAAWPESGPAPSSSPKPGLLDGLAELARPKSFEERLAEARKYSLIPGSLGGEANSQPEPASSSWLAGAQSATPAAAWPDAPAPKSVVRRDDADPTPEMHRRWLDAYFRYDARKSEPGTTSASEATSMLAPGTSTVGASSPVDEARQAQAARFAAARRLGQWRGRGTEEYEPRGSLPAQSPSREAEIPYLNRMTGAEPYLERSDGSIALNPDAWAPALGRTPSGGVYLNPDAWGQPAAQALNLLGIPTLNLRGTFYGEPAPPPPPLPDTPQKIPSRDPRAVDASIEMANIAAQVGPTLVPTAAAGLVAATRPIGRAAARMLEAWGILRPAVRSSRYSISKQLYNIRRLRPRRFEDDYDAGVSSDATGKLLTDMEGETLEPETILVGRQVEGGKDVPFPVAKQEYLTKKLTGRYSTTLPASSPELKGAVGKTPTIEGVPVEIILSDELKGSERISVHSHELAHAIDDTARQIQITKKMKQELEALYNTTNNPKRTPDGLDADPQASIYTPKDRGYGPRKAQREYIAEAIRIYMFDPNYIKTVAPETAAQIRHYVNTHQRLKKIIQFNSILAVPVVGSKISDDE